MPALYLSRTYDEAHQLLIEARGFAQLQYGTGTNLQCENRTVRNRESVRLTSKLAQIAACLLAQRAYQAGEISREEISTGTYRLSEESVSLDWQSATECELPPSLLGLLGFSYNLYRRVQRLNQQFITY